ncbi:hypothetical protein FDA94_25510 [Herbidospora galbida]|uniref:Uncharacterized protein n=1 Tax=Herbidospora galbida TaxID=2575442 RepID=A0A4U3MB02_9ACTN|nr:hypothetical protein FDA94_25510 [Herbidospora galbida]
MQVTDDPAAVPRAVVDPHVVTEAARRERTVVQLRVGVVRAVPHLEDAGVVVEVVVTVVAVPVAVVVTRPLVATAVGGGGSGEGDDGAAADEGGGSQGAGELLELHQLLLVIGWCLIVLCPHSG